MLLRIITAYISEDKYVIAITSGESSALRTDSNKRKPTNC